MNGDYSMNRDFRNHVRFLASNPRGQGSISGIDCPNENGFPLSVVQCQFAGASVGLDEELADGDLGVKELARQLLLPEVGKGLECGIVGGACGDGVGGEREALVEVELGLGQGARVHHGMSIQGPLEEQATQAVRSEEHTSEL